MLLSSTVTLAYLLKVVGMGTTAYSRSRSGMVALEFVPPTVTGRQKTGVPMIMTLMVAGWAIGVRIKILEAALNQQVVVVLTTQAPALQLAMILMYRPAMTLKFLVTLECHWRAVGMGTTVS